MLLVLREEVQCCEVGSSEKTRILKQQNYVYLKLLLNRKEFQKNTLDNKVVAFS